MTGSRGRQFQAAHPVPPSLSNGAAAWRWLLAVALAITAQQGWAALCSFSATGVAFGSYDVFSNQSVDSTSNIAVTCDVSSSYSISLSPGGGSYASRVMASGGHTLNYNLYTDATRTVIWGDGTGSTATVNGSGITGNHTVYGRIPARQNVYVATYSDTITVTLSF